MPDRTPTIAEQIADIATLQFTDAEIAQIMQIDLKQLTKHHAPDIDRGRLLAEAEVRRSLLQLAKQGSSPAQNKFLELNKRAKQQNRR